VPHSANDAAVWSDSAYVHGDWWALCCMQDNMVCMYCSSLQVDLQGVDEPLLQTRESVRVSRP
jgi:hypothetical protein